MRGANKLHILTTLLAGYCFISVGTAQAASPRLSFTPPPAAPPPANDQLPTASSGGKAQLSRPLFLTGVIVGSVGAASALSFGFLSFTQTKKLEDGISTGIDQSSYDRIANRGKAYNTLTMTSAALTGVGYALALIVYAIDFNRCGPLATRSRRCRESQNSNAHLQWQSTGFRF